MKSNTLFPLRICKSAVVISERFAKVWKTCKSLKDLLKELTPREDSCKKKIYPLTFILTLYLYFRTEFTMVYLHTVLWHFCTSCDL